MKLTNYLIPITIAILTLMSCNTEPTLQDYLIEKQNDASFMKMDVAPRTFISENVTMDAEQERILKSIKKFNVVALEATSDNVDKFTMEKEKVNTLLQQEQYELLGAMNMKGTKLKFLYAGTEELIDEGVVFASMKDKGFALVRIVGDDMNPDDLASLMMSLQGSEMETSQLGNILNMFN